MTVHAPVYRAEVLLRIPSEILTKLLVRGENNILAVLSFKSSDGVRKIPPLGPQFSAAAHRCGARSIMHGNADAGEAAPVAAASDA
jgi:hypothetical protein